MDKSFVIRIVSRATLWVAAFAVLVSLAAVPQLSAQGQDNQRVSPSQAEPAQAPAMQRPDTTPAEPKAEPEINTQNPQHEMDQKNDQDRDQDRSRVSQGDRDRDIDQADVKAFDEFLDSHPEVAKDLRQNPSLVDDQQFVSSHPGLKEFLESHPNIRKEIKAHPEAFMNKEKKYEHQEQH
jgi:hypothetical protein